MKKINLFLIGVAALLVFAACSKNDAGYYQPVNTTGQIKMLNPGAVGTWDEGYVADNGVYLMKSSAKAPSARRKAPAAEEAGTEMLYFSSSDGATRAMLLINKENNRPLQLVMNDGTLNFSFLGDNVLELVFKRGSDISYVDQITYDKEAIEAALAAADYKNNLQQSLFFYDAVMDVSKLTAYPTVVAVTTFFREIINFKFDGSSTLTAAQAGLPADPTGVATVVAAADAFEAAYVDKVYNTITIWTGKASFKVGGSSCTLGGTVFCADPSFADAGDFGIVCDQDKSKLFFGQAEFQGQAVMTDDQNFEVEFRGFNPKTTYYYRAFYKFKDGVAYGDLVLDPAQVNPADGVAYDVVIKEFVTGEYKYTVDVVMLMDISGSMSDELGMVKENAKDFYNLFKGKCDEKNINLLGLTTQVVTFSDINVDREYALNKSDVYNMLVEEEHNAFETYVNQIDLTYGGDTPESALEALATAFQRSSWGPDDGLHRQVFILWTDATYKTINEGICMNYEYDEDGQPIYDEEGYPVGTPMYTAWSYDQVHAMWDGMPSGRRMILFAPYGTWGDSNEGDWALMDEWKNVYHEANSTESFNNFGKSLDYIIEEMIGKEKTTDVTSVKIPFKSAKNTPVPYNK